MNNSASIANLNAGLKQFKLNLSATQVSGIAVYLQLLQKWNQVYNLTAIRNPDEMLTHHVFDSLAVAPLFESCTTVLDVGTGAGLPGLILAILFPTKQFTLLDSNSKKTSFLKQVVRELKLANVTIETCRLEAYQPLFLFDCVTSRAFASLDNFVELTQKLIQPAGQLLALKGPKSEVEAALLHEKMPALKIKVHPVTVPFLNELRFVVEIAL